ncbi:hypothetical protein, partial [Yersinia pestis]
ITTILCYYYIFSLPHIALTPLGGRGLSPPCPFMYLMCQSAIAQYSVASDSRKNLTCHSYDKQPSPIGHLQTRANQ